MLLCTGDYAFGSLMGYVKRASFFEVSACSREIKMLITVKGTLETVTPYVQSRRCLQPLRDLDLICPSRISAILLSLNFLNNIRLVQFKATSPDLTLNGGFYRE